MMLPGMRRETRRQPQNRDDGAERQRGRGAGRGPGVREQRLRPAEKVAWNAGVCRPKKSRICVLAIRTAMPLVKPMTTGRGMYFTAVPRPVMPSSIRITPAISVHMNSPSRP